MSQEFFTGDGAASSNQPLAMTLQGMTRHAVKRGIAHPQYQPGSAECPNPGPDVALAELEEPITDIEAVPIESPPDDVVWCQVVGLGIHDVASVGEKRWDSERVTQLTPASIETQRVPGNMYYGMSDHGDSGGPAFCRRTHGPGRVIPPPPSVEPSGALTAVTSCGAGAMQGVYALVAPVKSWITQVTDGEVQ